LENTKTEPKTEAVIYTTNNKSLANSLRCALLQNFRRVWIFVYNQHGEFTVTAASEFCGKLKEETVNDMLKFTSNFLNEDMPLQSVYDYEKTPIPDPVKDILSLIKY
jgi:hypothetical protein